MPLNEVFDYFRHYDKHSFQIYACQGNEPSQADVAALEIETGFRLPEEFREFTMSPLGGLYMEVRESLWPRPKEYDVGPFWSFLYGLCVFGIAENIPDWLDLRRRLNEFRGEGGSNELVPFLKPIGDPDRYCFDAGGRIIHWSHEEPDERRQVPLSFGELLMSEIRKLEDRKDRKLRGEDKQTNPRTP